MNLKHLSWPKHLCQCFGSPLLNQEVCCFWPSDQEELLDCLFSRVWMASWLTYTFCAHRRGLNPPHRVKSISMTTFTQQEIEFLQKHSNEVQWSQSSSCCSDVVCFTALLLLTDAPLSVCPSPPPSRLRPAPLPPRPLVCPLQVCKQIWLGLYDDRTLVVPDFREPQKVKEFLQEKYEKKRW